MGRDTAYWYRRGRGVPVGEGRVAFRDGGACGRRPGRDSTNAQGAKARAISTSAVITTGSSQAITKSVVAAIKIITTTRALKLSSSINRRIGLAIMELMIAINAINCCY